MAWSVEMSNMSMPSPLAMVKNISAFSPMSLSVARIRPTGVPVWDDSRTLNWNIPEQKQMNTTFSGVPVQMISAVFPLSQGKELNK